MADVIYDSFFEYLGDGTIDLDTHELKLALLSNSHTPARANTIYDHVSGEELADGNGYTTGGAALTGVTWGQTDGVAVLDAENPSWAGATFTARYAALYQNQGIKPLIKLFDYLADKSVTAGTFSHVFHASGILRVKEAT